MSKATTHRYRFDDWSARTYDSPIGDVEPGDIRELDFDPADGHWTQVPDVQEPADSASSSSAAVTSTPAPIKTVQPAATDASTESATDQEDGK